MAAEVTLKEMEEAVLEAAMLTAWQAEALRKRVAPHLPDIIELPDIEERALRLLAAHEYLRGLQGGQ